MDGKVAILALLCVCPALLATEQGRPPNILLITADNLGYGDLPCYRPGSPVKAPRLDRLAQEGARLTSFYTASPTCTVSRACLLTGRVAQRHGLDYQLPGIKGNYGIGLDHREILIPQVLKSGPTPYATGCFGKWNIGFAPGSRPTERGFDTFVGHASGNMDYYHHVYCGKHDLYKGTDELHVDGQYSTDLFADSAIEFIRQQTKSGRPWFCYLPFNAPHFPNARNKKPGQRVRWQAPDRAFAAYGFSPDESDPQKRYYAVVTALDEAIGRVLDTVDSLGIGNNTFVFFYSDNGAFRLDRKGIDVGVNDPLRHGGVTCWEGGIRVVAMARWPGKIPAGSVVAEPLWSPDLLTSFAQLANAPLPTDRVLDGKDLLPALLQRQTSKGRTAIHDSLYFRYSRHAALRQGNWKIVRQRPDEPWQLFNLAHDIGEKHNLADKYPQRVHELDKVYRQWEASF